MSIIANKKLTKIKKAVEEDLYNCKFLDIKPKKERKIKLQ